MLSQNSLDEIGLPSAVVSLFLALVAVVKWIQGRYAQEVSELRTELKSARIALDKANDDKLADRVRLAKLEALCEAQEELERDRDRDHK